MSYPIDRKEAIKCVETLFSLGDCYCDKYSIIGMLNGLPSVEQERKIGYWEHVALFTVQCTECGAQFHELEYDNFCPNCGAKMERE